MNGYGDSVVIVDAPLVDGYGGRRVRDWANATRTTVSAAVQPVSARQIAATEMNAGRMVVISGQNVHVPAGTAVDATMRVEWGGDTYWVEGPPDVHHMFGVEDHIEFVMRLIEEPST